MVKNTQGVITDWALTMKFAHNDYLQVWSRLMIYNGIICFPYKVSQWLRCTEFIAEVNMAFA